MNKKISIVIPIYNQEKYLDQAFQSLINQTYHNIEIVAVDDGSTDSSLEIINAYKDNNPVIKVVIKPNGGLIDAVSEGIRNATGEYVAFMDPDDYIDSTYIEKLASIIDGKDIAACGIYSSEIEDEKEILKRQVWLDSSKEYDEEGIRILQKDFFWDKNMARSITPIFQSRCNKLYKKSIVDQIVDDYQKYKEAVIGEDTIFNYLALKKAKSMVTSRSPEGYFYCIRKGESMTRSLDAEKRYEKNKRTYEAFCSILNVYHDKKDMACELFYLQMQGLLYQASSYPDTYKRLQSRIRDDTEYKETYRVLIRNAGLYGKAGMTRKWINELFLPVEFALGIRRMRNVMGIARAKLKGRISNVR